MEDEIQQPTGSGDWQREIIVEVINPACATKARKVAAKLSKKIILSYDAKRTPTSQYEYNSGKQSQ